jgi:hypothetical protein
VPEAGQIATREGLIAALNEAAEIEHGLLLQYLFAALTLKQSPDENVTPEQFVQLRKWKGIILSIAVEEMGHLGTVSNLLAAIGVAPRFERPEFPAPTGYYPFPFELLRFSEEALKRFVTAELPRGGKVEDCLVDETLKPPREIAPEVPSYKYVGELYDQIAAGFRSIPEDVLFIGSPTRQVDNNWSVNVRMQMITDRTSALQAVEAIVKSGEGSPEHRVGTHYGRFCQMWRGFRSSPFEAARPVVRNPRTRELRGLPSKGTYTLITDPTGLAVGELFNATYAVMLRLLAQFFGNAGESDSQRDTIRSAAARLMSVAVRPIAEVLTTLPAMTNGDETAGPSFELYLPIIVPPEPKNRWILLIESLDGIVREADRIAGSGANSTVARLGAIADTLRIMQRTLEEAAGGTA